MGSGWTLRRGEGGDVSSQNNWVLAAVWILWGLTDQCMMPPLTCHASSELCHITLIASLWAHCHEECDTALHITSHTPKHHCVTAAWQGTWHVMTPADSFTRSQSVQCTALVYLCQVSPPTVHLYSHRQTQVPVVLSHQAQSVQASRGWHKSVTRHGVRRHCYNVTKHKLLVITC